MDGFCVKSLEDDYSKEKLISSKNDFVYTFKSKKDEKIYIARSLRVLKPANLMRKGELGFVKFALENPHPKIPKFYEIFKDESRNRIFVIMEFLPGKTISKHLKDNTFTSEQWWNCAEQVLESLDYIHSNGYVHRDVKLQNIIYNSETMKAILIDFGYCFDINNFILVDTMLGTPLYLAPEVYDFTVTETGYCKVDIWALGICLYQMLGFKVWVSASTKKDVRNLIHERIIEAEISSCVKDEKTRDFLLDCLKMDFRERLDAKSLLQKYFNRPDDQLDQHQQLLNP
jgi:serine/threonine protein kinase